MTLTGAKLAAAGLVAVAAFKYYSQNLKARPVPITTYQDVQGTTHTLGTSGKVTLLGFWISNCGYSDRVLKLLKIMRERYSEDQLEIVAFYLNPISNESLLGLKSPAEYPFTFAAAQQRRALIAKLHYSFRIRGGGSDIYVVDRQGKIHTVDTSSREAKREELVQAIESELGKSAISPIAKR